MAFGSGARTRARGRGGGGRIGKRVLIGIAVLIALIIVVVIFSNIWANVLWYRAAGYGGVYTTVIGTRVVLFFAGAVFLGGIVLLNLVIARRLRPAFVPNAPDQQVLARYREVLEPFLRVVALLVCGLIALIAGLTADGNWETVQEFLRRTSFGVTDPQFGLDVSFYTFVYPFLRMLFAYAFAAVILSFFAAAAVHYLYGGLRAAPRGARRVSDGARAHLSVILGVFMILKALAYWLDRYGLVFSGRGVTDGASYTDVHAVLPAKTILAVIALICAGLFIASVVRRGMMLAGVSLGLLILSAILVGAIYPAIVQNFEVKPNEAQKEAPYIARNIKATRAAYDIADAQIKPYNARIQPTEQQAHNAADVSNIRLVDPSVVSKTFQQLQQIRAFYSFPEALDIDRYTVDGKEGTSIVAVRELPAPPADQRNWVNSHLVYTHGFGFVAAEGNKVDSEGKPVWQESNIPPEGDLGKFQPRIYFGENTPAYSIVGAPEGSQPAEFDYASESKTGQRNTTYEGSGGVGTGSFFRRLVFAIHFHDINILLSDGIHSNSHIMYDRDPRDRVQKAAPFLELDGDPYPALVNGRITWIVDGYTKTDLYPYSERASLDEVTRDSLTANPAFAAQPSERINYMRNSVKATVDAYSGKITLYTWDPQDPLLQTWKKVFPGTVRPASDMNQELRAHLRYPEDLFKAQRNMLAKYHVTNPGAFYGGQDFWSVPRDPTKSDNAGTQPPYYLLIQMPGQDKPEFSLTSTLVPKKRPNLAAFMSVSSDPGKDYGKIRVLRLPRDTAVPGPGTIQGNFESYAPAAKTLSLLRNGGSTITFGNLLTLPYAGGLLYVEPVYVQAKSGESYPLLQRVLVSFGKKIGFAPTLKEALNQVFTTKPVSGQQQQKSKDTTSNDLRSKLADAIADAQTAYADGQDALQRGDFEAYGKAQKRLKAALDRSQRLQKRLGIQPSSRPTPSASGGSPAPSASGRPKP